MLRMLSRLRPAARELARAVRPTARRTLLGESLVLPFEARRARVEQDYPLQLALAREATLLYDVGSNVGVLAALLARAMPAGGTLTCFEANEATAHVCAETLARNGATARVVNAVVGECTGALVAFADSSIVPGYLGQVAHQLKPSLALDDYAAARGERPDLVKIDVEGAERLVLAGMARLLREARPTVVVELHSLEGNAGVAVNASAILPLLAVADYRMIYLRTGAVVTDPAQFGTRGRTHALCLPAERPVPPAVRALDLSGL